MTNFKTILFLSITSLLILSCNNKSDKKEMVTESEDLDLIAEVPSNLYNDVYWGDTHLHTSYSTDAGMIGNTLGPEEAYKFARGEEVTSATGIKAKLARPLDFLVVADHAENLGLAPAIAISDPGLLKNEWGKWAHDLAKKGGGYEVYVAWEDKTANADDPLNGDLTLSKSYWNKSLAAAKKYNEPGKFTSLLGFEWTSGPDGNNLHRNVIFRDDEDKASQIVPFSLYDSQDPEKLWEWMQAYESNIGGRALAIPHNGNLSNGLMFDDITYTSKVPIDRSYAEARMRWEPVYEVTQMKGDGEAHPSLSPNDEFADYATWDKGSFGAEPKTKEMLPKEYAREAYKRGLQYEEKLGANPFKFGMIGSTDAHNSLSVIDENNYFGKAAPTEPNTPGRFEMVITGAFQDRVKQDITIKSYNTTAAGYTAVWAKSNTRAELWDGLNRKEVYATTGTRIKVRLFAGWEFTQADATSADMVKLGYEKGVPMGGDLKNAPEGKAPSFMVSALKDPDWGNLDRVQIIKGWLDTEGNTHEKVYDIAVSDNRTIDSNGRCMTPVGNTVNINEATYKNTIGATSLVTFWKDPNFDPKQRAFYYVRVMEIPTPTWLAYDQVKYKTKAPDDAVLVQQERAYTSPIWYTPR